MKITQQQIAQIKANRRELYRDEGLDPEKIAGLFARGYFTILASQPGTGKTWLTELLICQLSLGGSILAGLMPDANPHKVVMLAGETGGDLLNQRLARTSWGYNPENIAIYNAIDLAKKGVPYLLNTEEGKATLAIIMHAEKPDILFIDTLISWHVADESNQADMTDIYVYLMKLADYFKCAIVVNHHMRKRGTNSPNKLYTQDDVIGSSAGIRLARDVYLLTEEKDHSVTIKHAKSWDKKIDPISFSIVDDGIYLDLAFKTAEASGNNADKFADFIEQLTPDNYITISGTASYLGITEQLARYYIKKYLKSNQLMTADIGGVKAYRKRQ